MPFGSVAIVVCRETRDLARAITDLNTLIRDVRNLIVGLEREALQGGEFNNALQALVMSTSETQTAKISFPINQRDAERFSGRPATLRSSRSPETR